jgi:AAA domain
MTASNLAVMYREWEEAEEAERLADDEKVESGVKAKLLAERIDEETRRRHNTAARPPVGSLGRSAATLLSEVPVAVNWLIPGLMGPGWSVKVAAREKVGKGVFCAYLLGCLERGEPTVFGPSTQATALVYTEEPEDAIREKIADAGLLRASIVDGYALAGLSWGAKVEALVDEAVFYGHKIIYIDNLSRATGVSGDEENNNTLGRLTGELGDRAKAAGLGGVLLNHHHKKGGDSIWDKSRGGTALAAAVDVEVAMEEVGGTLDRRRRLSARGRMSATRWVMGIELADDRRQYVQVDIPESTRRVDKAALALQHDFALLDGYEHPVTAKEFSVHFPGMAVNTVKAHLGRLVDAGCASRDDEYRETRWAPINCQPSREFD